jgi:putative ABC transport system permease protein
MRQVIAIVPITLRRLRAHVGLTLCALLALTTAVAIPIAIPIYAEGAGLRILRTETAQQEQRQGRSPFALLLRYVAAQNQNRPLDWAALAPADAFLTVNAPERIGLPLDGLGRHARTEPLRMLLPAADAGSGPTFKPATLGFVSGLDDQIRLIDGARPAPGAPDQPIEVLISTTLANEVGLNPGAAVTLIAELRGETISLPIVVAGIWEARNPRDPAWFYQVDSFRDVLLVDEATFTGVINAALPASISQMVWFVRLNATSLAPGEAVPLLRRIEAVRAQVAGLAPGLRLEQSPIELLNQYRRQATTLTLQLFLFGAPALGLVISFITLIAGLLAERQRAVIALFKTRGVRDEQLLGIAMLEWTLLGAGALALGAPLGLLCARIITNTRSFLQLAADMPPLALSLGMRHLPGGIAIVGVTLLAVALPIVRATQFTIVDAQQQASRTLRTPLWQRAYLDLLLLAPTLYVIIQLRRRNDLFGLQTQGDIFANPLIFVLPVTLGLALGLLAMRLLPMLFSALARCAAWPNWTGPLVVLRVLARQPAAYRGPLLLLILTLSLATFSASMAATLDGALEQAVRYQVGAPTQLLETGASTANPAQPGAAPPPVDSAEEPRFLFLPVEAHLDVPGITAATRVGRYQATLRLGGLSRSAQLVGIDRSTFPQVTPFFAPEWAGGASLGELMNRLGQTSNGVIVSRDMLTAGLQLDATLPATLELYGDRRETSLRIVAVVDHWPGIDLRQGPLIVGNLNYIFDQMGGQYPYDVWIDRDPAVALTTIERGVRELGVALIDLRDAETILRAEQARPTRQGAFGMLSIGFIVAGGLAFLGFCIAALVSARQRMIELGVLQALGMGRISAIGSLILEQGVLIGIGTGIGTGVGLSVATLVVPLLQPGGALPGGAPPYPPLIAWEQIGVMYSLFLLALSLTLGMLIMLLDRMRLFQAVKLGDTA